MDDIATIEIQAKAVQEMWDELTKLDSDSDADVLDRAKLRIRLVNSIPWALKTISELSKKLSDVQARPFWISWYQTATMPGFTLDWPWWYTGYAGDGTTRTIAAAVMASDEDAAEDIILSSFDVRPGGVMWRFNEERDKGWTPFSGRFPRADWMKWPE